MLELIDVFQQHLIAIVKKKKKAFFKKDIRSNEVAMSSKTRKTFFAVYFFIGQFRILLLKRYLVCIGTSKKRLETPLLRTKQLNFLLPASRQVFTYKQSTITHQKVTAMQPADEEGVDDMATLTELHGGAIMHNLHQRYRRDQIYVSAASAPGSLGVPGRPLSTSISCLQRTSS